MTAKSKTKKVLYHVQCVYNEKHVFEKIFEIKEGSEGKKETEVETYCPFCDQLVTVTVKGKVKPDTTILRKIVD